jgi:hypothetical protein
MPGMIFGILTNLRMGFTSCIYSSGRTYALATQSIWRSYGAAVLITLKKGLDAVLGKVFSVDDPKSNCLWLSKASVYFLFLLLEVFGEFKIYSRLS